LASDRAVRHAVEPVEGLCAGRDLVDLSPGYEEDVGHDVLDLIAIRPSEAIGVDLPVVAIVDVGELGFLRSQIGTSLNWLVPEERRE
jgi:hypothetical protein